MSTTSGVKVPPIGLVVNGLKYEGFFSLQFTKEMTGVVHGFTLSMTDVNALEKIQNALRPDVLASVYLGERLLTMGYIDSTETGSDLRLSITGRSRASRLVDCSAPKREYNGVSLSTLGAMLCKPYGIVFTDTVGVTKTKKIKSEGESPLEVLRKWLEDENDLWLCSNAQGNLELKAKPTKSMVQFVHGENVYSYRIAYDYTGVFSEYGAYSSQYDDLLGSSTTVKGVYKDDYLKTYKNKSFEANRAKDAAACGAAAKKAAISAKSRMMTLSLEAPVFVAGSQMTDAGNLVSVTLPHHSVKDHPFIVNRLTLEVSATSFKSSLELIDTQSFNGALKGSDMLFKFDGAFGRAFHAAKSSGEKTFLWRGKRYNTLWVDELEVQNAS